jgi:hypothetical protein
VICIKGHVELSKDVGNGSGSEWEWDWACSSDPDAWAPNARNYLFVVY